MARGKEKFWWTVLAMRPAQAKRKGIALFAILLVARGAPLRGAAPIAGRYGFFKLYLFKPNSNIEMPSVDNLIGLRKRNHGFDFSTDVDHDRRLRKYKGLLSIILDLSFVKECISFLKSREKSTHLTHADRSFFI